MGAGLLNLALFHAISPSYRADAAGTVNKGGILYGLGCLAATLLVAGHLLRLHCSQHPGLHGRWSLASSPGFMREESYTTPPEGTHPTLRQALQDFRSPGAVLFALLIFFQFGNEWSIAGWLPIFLIRRVGLSPSSSLMILALVLAVPARRAPDRRGHSASACATDAC